MHLAMANVNSISDFFDNDNIANEGTTGCDGDIEGDNSVLESPDNSTNVIYSSRDIYNSAIREVFISSRLSSKIMGMGYLNDNINNGGFVNVEMDFHNLVYRYGYIGSVVWICPFVFLLMLLLRKFFRHPLHYLNNAEILMCGCRDSIGDMYRVYSRACFRSSCSKLYRSCLYGKYELFYR